jgi:hypothetical protein
LSGKVSDKGLPSSIDSTYSLYELTLRNVTPTPTFLNCAESLDAFRVAYQGALAELLKHHGSVPAIDLFPAIPAPIAVLCGRELLPKVHPQLRVYDNDKHKGGFTYQLTLN